MLLFIWTRSDDILIITPWHVQNKSLITFIYFKLVFAAISFVLERI